MEKQLFNYYGGKVRLASKIAKYVNNIYHTVYCEPYCGGASVLFAKNWAATRNSHNYKEVLNDQNNLLINCYRVFQARYKEITHLLEYTAYSESEHRKAKDICKNPEKHDELWLAWAFIVNVEMSFANDLGAGWGRGIISQNHAVTWAGKKRGYKQVFQRLSDVYFSCTDALKCIKQWDSPTTLFYIDPPYPHANQGHYKGFTQSDFVELIDVLKNIRGSFILSNYPNDAVPKEWQLIGLPAIMSASKNKTVDKKRTECLWIVDKNQTYGLLKLLKEA